MKQCTSIWFVAWFQLATPPKVPIPRRYVELELEEILSSEEIEARHLKTEKIKNLLAKSR